MQNCGGVCRDVASDSLNCGACGNACSAGEVCSAGVCTPTCGAGLVNCSGVCRDLGTDRLNCGACGRTCAAGQVCSGGSCVVSCGGGLVNCGGVCRDLGSDRLNCGTCGRSCDDGQVCNGGACVVSCGGGLRNCGGICRDLASDRANCGACGRSCGPGQICSGGTCILSCPPGQVVCGSECVDGTSNVCGAPIDLGILPDGATVRTTTHRLPAAGQVEWFRVRFPTSYVNRLQSSGTPSIQFGVNQDNVFRIDVYRSCGSGHFCTGSYTSWTYADNASTGLNQFSTRNDTWPDTVLIRVTRVTAGVDCRGYSLELSR